jgi:hypothetical protein
LIDRDPTGITSLFFGGRAKKEPCPFNLSERDQPIEVIPFDFLHPPPYLNAHRFLMEVIPYQGVDKRELL